MISERSELEKAYAQWVLNGTRFGIAVAHSHVFAVVDLKSGEEVCECGARRTIRLRAIWAK